MLNVINRLSPNMLGTKVNASRLLLVLILAPIFSFTGIAASNAAITPITLPVGQDTLYGITITALTTYLNEPNSNNGLVFRMTAPTPSGSKIYAFYNYPRKYPLNAFYLIAIRIHTAWYRSFSVANA